MTNALYYGDNLAVLRDSIATESVDLIYLDPLFNSSASYNLLFKSPSGEGSQAQIEAFEDTWHWNESAERAFDEVVTGPHSDASIMLRAMRSALGENDMMAYLAMMAVRLIELHRVLKSTGSLYLHCDQTASHYLKIILDAIFGPMNYRNEIIWKRSNPKSLGSINFPTCTDTILRYKKTAKATFHQPYEAHDPDYVESAYKYEDAGGVYRLLPLLNPNDNRPNLTYEFLGVIGYGAGRKSAWRRRIRMVSLCSSNLARCPSTKSISRTRKAAPSRTAGRTFRKPPATNRWATRRKSHSPC